MADVTDEPSARLSWRCPHCGHRYATEPHTADIGIGVTRWPQLSSHRGSGVRDIGHDVTSKCATFL